MRVKKLLTILLATIIMTCFGTVTYAEENQPQYAITDDAVIIDYIPYEIVDNTIQYNGMTFEIAENYTLISYDENGAPTYFFLPVEQNKITDPELIAKLNALVGADDSLTRGLPTEFVDLPCYGYVPSGQWYTETPAYNAIESSFYYYTYLHLYNFSSKDREFTIIYFYCDTTGTWGYNQVLEHDFSKIPYFSCLNYSGIRYGMFSMTNRYGAPSPSYNYEIFMSNATY